MEQEFREELESITDPVEKLRRYIEALGFPIAADEIVNDILEVLQLR